MGTGEGMGKAELCPGLLWAVVWFLLLIFIGWPVGFLIAQLYIFLLPFGACIEPIKGVTDALLGIVQFPYQFAENMPCIEASQVDGGSCCTWAILKSMYNLIGLFTGFVKVFELGATATRCLRVSSVPSLLSGKTTTVSRLASWKRIDD